MFKMDVNGLKQLLSVPKKIVITTHHKPDGDAMGSSLGLYNYLIQKKHMITVVTPNDWPDFLSWMPGVDSVIEFEKEPEKAEQLITSAELLFCLDFNTTSRVEKFEPVLKKANCTKVLIDHHLYPDSFCDYTYSFPAACATAELVFDFICNMDEKPLINADVAKCLYTGIMTDTASFRFETMRAETHRKIADLMDAGAPNYMIHEAVYDNSSEMRMRLLGYCLNNKLKVLQEFSTAYISLTRDELNSFGHVTGDTEGIVNYALGIKGIKLGVFFTERKDVIKISFRSKGDFSVRDLASKYFEGGGHRNASGGKSCLSMDETIKKFVDLLPQYKEELKNTALYEEK